MPIFPSLGNPGWRKYERYMTSESFSIESPHPRRIIPSNIKARLLIRVASAPVSQSYLTYLPMLMLNRGMHIRSFSKPWETWLLMWRIVLLCLILSGFYWIWKFIILKNQYQQLACVLHTYRNDAFPSNIVNHSLLWDCRAMLAIVSDSLTNSAIFCDVERGPPCFFMHQQMLANRVHPRG